MNFWSIFYAPLKSATPISYSRAILLRWALIYAYFGHFLHPSTECTPILTNILLVAMPLDFECCRYSLVKAFHPAVNITISSPHNVTVQGRKILIPKLSQKSPTLLCSRSSAVIRRH